MGQQVENLLRAQSKYGLMGSSAKTGKKISTGHRSSFLIKLSFGIGHPHLYIKCSVYVWGRSQGFQIFKRNSIILIRSKVMAFLVILLSPWSLHCLHRPHVIPTSSPCPPHCPHIVPIAPKRSPCGPHHPCHPCHPRCPHPCCPHRPHVIPVIPMSSPSSPHCPEGAQIISNPPR